VPFLCTVAGRFVALAVCRMRAAAFCWCLPLRWHVGEVELDSRFEHRSVKAKVSHGDCRGNVLRRGVNVVVRGDGPVKIPRPAVMAHTNCGISSRIASGLPMRMCSRSCKAECMSQSCSASEQWVVNSPVVSTMRRHNCCSSSPMVGGNAGGVLVVCLRMASGVLFVARSKCSSSAHSCS
jgi:hypothetical protein